jgi:anti-sigma regulatory factor (Ser/Thr protein kinase)
LSAARPPAAVLVIPSRTEFLGVVREVAKRVAILAGFAEATAESVALAVDECATNVIKHAYQGRTDQTLELHLEYRAGELRIDVIDSGPPAERRPLPQLDLERYAAERRKGGLGVHLMDRIMDSVSYTRAARGNVCSMVKRKDARPDAS